MSLVRAQQGEPKKRPSEQGGLFFASRIVRLERVCRFRIAKSAAHSRRRQTQWRLPRRRRRAKQGEPGKSTCFRKCFFSYIRLAASDIAFGSDIRFASVKANIISLRGSAISLLRQQKYHAAHRAAYHYKSLSGFAICHRHNIPYGVQYALRRAPQATFLHAFSTPVYLLLEESMLY